MVNRIQFEIASGDRINILDDALYALNSADNVSRYDEIYHVPSRVSRHYLAKRGVAFEGVDGTVRSCLLLFPSGGGLSERNVLLHRERLFIASGVALVAVDLPTLSIAWTIDLQTGAENGIHFVGPNRILAIGDFDSTLLSWDGDLIWAAYLPGILVPPAVVDADSFSFSDDEGRKHRVLLANGQCTES